MHDSPRKLIVFLTLACAALLAGRIGGAHLHLCLDGKSPAISIAAFEADHAESTLSVSGSHRDTDVSIFEASPLKPRADLPGLPAMLAGLLFFLVPYIGNFRPVRPDAHVPGRSFAIRLRPPPRGPPLLSFL